jgi:hypothetical protein
MSSSPPRRYKWNIFGDSPMIGKEQVLEVSKMLQLESFPNHQVQKRLYILGHHRLAVSLSTGAVSSPNLYKDYIIEKLLHGSPKAFLWAVYPP